MARSVVLVPFGWCPNGFDREEVKPGDERDFGDVTDGLVGLKMIGPVSDPVVVPAAEPVAVEAPIVVETPVVVETPAVVEPEVVEVEPLVVTPASAPAPIRRKRN